RPARRGAKSRAIRSVAATLVCCARTRRSASSGATPYWAAYWVASSANASVELSTGCAFGCAWTAPVIRAAPAAKDRNMPQDLAADQSIFDLTPPTDEQFQSLVADLDEQEKHVLLEHGTEAPFCGIFLTEQRTG